MQRAVVSEKMNGGMQALLVWGGLALATILAVAGFLIASSKLIGMGFPLDDAWIHQTYARNLAQYGEWAFNRGQPSAGSTAPLWSVLLALGYLLRLPYLGWTFLLGGFCLFGLAAAGEALARRYFPGMKSLFPWVGLFLIGEWHLVWASVSGMETLLYGLCILLVFWRSSQARGRAWGGIGLLVGASVWVRPEGITLLGPVVFTLLLKESSWRERARGFAWMVGGVGLLFAPYLLFNLFIQGSIWPNTFYAKQAEYAVQRQLPLLLRVFNEVKLPLIGSGIFLLPGFVVFCWKAWRERCWEVWGVVIWFLGYAFLYALRLPVIYQYGRYFIPAMPVYFIIGLAGTIQLVQGLRGSRFSWILARVGMLSGLVVWLAFYAIGAGRYAQDVAIIETEMVVTAKWVAASTPLHALVAAHDIGALGYFGDRRLLDLAGLVSPDVIPFIRNETRIAGWLDEQHADYLVVLTNWYSKLPAGKTQVFRSNSRFAIESGGSDMEVYQWSR
jgi:arabinofuranosyltransferase